MDICLTNDGFSFFIIQKYKLSEIYCKAKLSIYHGHFSIWELTIFVSKFLVVLTNNFSKQVIAKSYKAFFLLVFFFLEKGFLKQVIRWKTFT